MVDTCFVWDKHEPHQGVHICKTCFSKGKIIINDNKQLVLSINSKTVLIGAFTKDQIKAIHTVINDIKEE